MIDLDKTKNRALLMLPPLFLWIISSLSLLFVSYFYEVVPVFLAYIQFFTSILILIAAFILLIFDYKKNDR